MIATILIVGCKKVPFYASEDSVLVISSDRSFLKTGGDRAVITVLGFDVTGQPLHDHTIVLFTATLGTISPGEVEMTAGRATVEFFSGDMNGTAMITARSGLVEADPNPLEILIGSAALDHLSITADPSNLPAGGGRSKIRVFAFDVTGNLLPGIPITLSTTSGYFEEGHGVYITGDSGMVEDYLHTEMTATVTAEYGEDEVTTDVTVADVIENQLPTANFSYSPTTPIKNESVYFNGTLSSDGDGYIVRWEWDFGDGQTARGQKVTHSFNWGSLGPRTFNVVLKVTDDQGGVGVVEKAILITAAGK